MKEAMNNKDEFDQLQTWYRAHCDGDWEHSDGVAISTLDNPGWSISIEVSDVPELAKKPFTEVKRERSEHDWVHARVREDKFEAFGGPLNLREMLRIFLDWAME